MRTNFAPCRSLNGVVAFTVAINAVIVPNIFETVMVGLGSDPRPEYSNPSACIGNLS